MNQVPAPLTDRAYEVMGPAMDELSKALPANVTPEKFQAAFVTAVVNSPAIMECSPSSIRAALMKCAADGQVPDGRQAAIVPYKKRATYIPMVKGIINKAREQGEAFSITAECVYEHDEFHANMSDPDDTTHSFPGFDAERGDVVGAYAIFRARDGVVIHREIMTKAEIEKARDVSAMKSGAVWTKWYSEMARKTVIRRGSKYVPMSDELRTIVERDDEYAMPMRDITPPKHTYAERLNQAKADADGVVMGGFDGDAVDRELDSAIDGATGAQQEAQDEQSDTVEGNDPSPETGPSADAVETEPNTELLDGLNEGLAECKTDEEVTELCNGYQSQINEADPGTRKKAKLARAKRLQELAEAGV